MSATFKGMKCMHYMCSVQHTSLSLNAANCFVGGVDEGTATTRDGSSFFFNFFFLTLSLLV